MTQYTYSRQDRSGSCAVFSDWRHLNSDFIIKSRHQILLKPALLVGD